MVWNIVNIILSFLVYAKSVHLNKVKSLMIFFSLKIVLAAIIIAFASWLSGQNPKLAGFIIALPLVSLIAIAFSYYEHNDVEKTILFTKSILVAVPVSYLFFLPFFFAKSLNMNFLMIYGTGLGFIVVGFFIHKYITNFL